MYRCAEAQRNALLKSRLSNIESNNRKKCKRFGSKQGFSVGVNISSCHSVLPFVSVGDTLLSSEAQEALLEIASSCAVSANKLISNIRSSSSANSQGLDATAEPPLHETDSPAGPSTSSHARSLLRPTLEHVRTFLTHAECLEWLNKSGGVNLLAKEKPAGIRRSHIAETLRVVYKAHIASSSRLMTSPALLGLLEAKIKGL